MEFKDKLKMLRERNNQTLQDIATLVGVSKPTVQRWESGEIKNLGRDKIKALADALKTTPAYLMGWEDSPSPSDLEKIGAVPYHPTHKILVLGRISAGLPLYAEEHLEGYTYTSLNGESEYFGLRVTGDSMNAGRIMENDIVIVRVQPIVEDGEIAVVLVDDEDATIKRFYHKGNQVTLMPQSTNPENQPQIYNSKRIPIKVIGKVVESQSFFE